MSAVCYLLAWTGTATELDTDISVHTRLQELTTAMDVVGGEDAEEADTSM